MNKKSAIANLEKLICQIKNDKIDKDQTVNRLKCIVKTLNGDICNMKKLACETKGFTEINGEKLPGTLLPTQDQQVLLDIVNSFGQRVYMVKAVRKAGTRVGIHVHKYGGYTLILKGEMTDFVQGLPIKKYGPNKGYYMPPCTPMSAANLGEEDVELIDIFIGEPCQPFIEVMEPDWTFNRVGRFGPKC